MKSARSSPSSIFTFAVAVALAATLPACDRGEIAGPQRELAGGIVATFVVSGDEFRVWVTNPAGIQQILDLEAGRSTASIPNAPVARGPGEAEHNLPWSWHMDGEQLEMADATIEICDGRPSYVEDNLDDWIATVGRYCPWGAVLVGVQDYR